VAEQKCINLPKQFETEHKEKFENKKKSVEHSVRHYQMLKEIIDDPRLQGNTFIGIAYVSFETIEMKKKVMAYYKRNFIIEWFKWAFDLIFGWLIDIYCTGDKTNSNLTKS